MPPPLNTLLVIAQERTGVENSNLVKLVNRFVTFFWKENRAKNF